MTAASASCRFSRVGRGIGDGTRLSRATNAGTLAARYQGEQQRRSGGSVSPFGVFFVAVIPLNYVFYFWQAKSLFAKAALPDSHP
jgi:hypothetical protein